jgi:glutamyl-tRNA synthetase
LVPVVLRDYGYLITKKKLDEEDTFQDCLADPTEFVTAAVADAHLPAAIKKGTHRWDNPAPWGGRAAPWPALSAVCMCVAGEIIQLERRGFYICDANDAGSPLFLIALPDPKQITQTPAPAAATATGAAAPKK